MTLKVEISGCEGHGNCYTLCPEVFEPDDDGYVVVLDAAPDDRLSTSVRDAAENCPERAIRLVES